MSSDPAVLACVEVLINVRRQVAEATHRLRTAHAQTLTVADATRWQTEAARRFRDQTAQWCRDVAALGDEAEEVGAMVSRLQYRIALLMTDGAG